MIRITLSIQLYCLTAIKFIVAQFHTFEKCFFGCFMPFLRILSENKLSLHRPQEDTLPWHLPYFLLCIHHPPQVQKNPGSFRLPDMHFSGSDASVWHQFFLRSCASYLLYQMLIPWDPCKNTEPFCQICCLVKTSHPFFSGMQRNGNDQIRLPPFQIFFSEDAHCLCIKIPIFPTSVILKSYQRLSPDLSVPENT